MARALIRRLALSAATLAALSLAFLAQSAKAQGTGGTGATVTPATPNPSPSSTSTATPPVQGSPPATSHGTHVITVTFDYDFRKAPACSSTTTQHCVMQFIAYDISGGTKNPPMLFPIPLPAKPAGLVQGITKAGPPIDFESGKHLIAVSAMSPDGTHSLRSLCTTWITIP